MLVTALTTRSIVRAIAVDFDGTVTQNGRLSQTALAAVEEARHAGLRVILVTGRIFDELNRVVPGIAERFDVIVAENGAVAVCDNHVFPLAEPVDEGLVQELASLGTGVRRGLVISALSRSHSQLVATAIGARQLDCQIVTNRSELMVVPAGVSKASGLEYALEVVGLSPHTTLAIGDSENDLSMLLSCEIGAAVGGCVDVLHEHADVVATADNGDGVVEILQGPMMDGSRRVHVPRWRVRLGTDPSGNEFSLPASQVNILVSGPAGSGKSYVAGLVAEELIQLGYDIFVFDPEGDYETLGDLPNVATFGEHAVPEPDDVVALLRRGRSVVIDLSAQSEPDGEAYITRMAPPLAELRQESGRPDWVLIDEAHLPCGQHCPSRHFYTPSLTGHLVVTYMPERLDERLVETIDVSVTPAGDQSTVLVSRKGDTPGVAVKVASRRLGHLRHRHKYAVWGVPSERGFWFREGPGPANGTVAHNLEELRRALPACSDDALRHHARGHEFSRWVDQVLADHELAADMALLESRIQHAANATQLSQASRQLATVIEERIRTSGSTGS
jgi:hydroxymethylpyrimidine pyrophosphatase-like HAD family hydrolase